MSQETTAGTTLGNCNNWLFCSIKHFKAKMGGVIVFANINIALSVLGVVLNNLKKNEKYEKNEKCFSVAIY